MMTSLLTRSSAERRKKFELVASVVLTMQLTLDLKAATAELLSKLGAAVYLKSGVVRRRDSVATGVLLPLASNSVCRAGPFVVPSH
jgi:hypothetical protein